MAKKTEPWAWQLQGTITEIGRKGKKPQVRKFLNPWTSLSPKFVRKKLTPDVLAVFKTNHLRLGNKQLKGIRFPFWAIVFPKRSYLPPVYPHLQLWFLSRRFIPSLSFLDPSQKESLTDLVLLTGEAIDRFTAGNSFYRHSQKVLAFNATPFSFIKNKDGRYYAGGQSVRTFHLHFLLLPGRLKKIAVNSDQAALVYPTQFSLSLFKLFFGRGKVRQSLLGKRLPVEITDRGVSFHFSGDLPELISVLTKVDHFFHRLQLSMINSFYRDSRAFLKELKDVIKVKDLVSAGAEVDELILLGKERSLPEAKILLEKEIMDLGRSLEVSFPKGKIKSVLASLTIDQNGDIASHIGRRVVALRPGMGYGCFVYFKKNGFQVNLSPLDSLFPEGVMESTGFFFTEKIVVNKKPSWVKDLLSCFAKIAHPLTHPRGGLG